MSLTRKQMMEIAAFDWKRRTDGDFDGRRYGDVTGAKAPYFTECWKPCRGSDVYAGKPKPTRKTLRYNYIVADRARRRRDGSLSRPDVTVVHVAVRLDGAYRPVVKDVGRWHIKSGHLELRDIDYHGLGGWIVEWQKEDWAGGGRKNRAEARRADNGPRFGKPVDGQWWDGGKWKFNTGLTFPWHETVNPEALKGTKYEWCQYGDDTPCKAGLVDWLIMYSREPKIELLAKMGLHRLICPGGINALKDKRVRDWILSHRDEAAEKYRDGSPRWEMPDIVYAARNNVTVRTAEKRRMFIQDVRGRMRYRFVGANVRLDYGRLMKTIPKWHVSVEEYVRYLEHAHEGGLDLRNEGTLYPPTRGGRKAFMARLERLEADAARLKRNAKAKERRQLAKMMKHRAAEIAAFKESIERSKVIRSCGYTLVLAKTQDELVAEGKKMHNCVGCGTYGQAIVKGDSLIVMLKKHSASFCDIEIDRKSWKVRQCYLKHNKIAPKEVQELAKRLAAWFKEEHQRHMKRGTFKELRRKAS